MSKREQVNPRTTAMARSRGKDYREGWEDGVRSLDAEIARLRAEVEREPTREWYKKRCIWYQQQLAKAEAVVRAAEALIEEKIFGTQRIEFLTLQKALAALREGT